MRLPRFFFATEGATSAHSSEAALDHTFGPLSNVRPDLAAQEAGERQRQDDGKPPILAAEYGRPKLDSELEPAKEEQPKDGDKQPEAAREATPPADGDKTDTGSDPESPGEEQAALDALLAKYQGKPQSMAQAIREIRSLQTRTAEEKKTLEERVDAAAAVLDSDYDFVDGKYVLKTDVAAKVLRAQRTNGSALFRTPSLDEIRAQVEEQFREKALETIEDDQVPAFLSKWKPVIEQTAKAQHEAAKTQAEAHRTAMDLAVGDIIGRHFSAHPDHKDLLPEIDKIYAGIPVEARQIAFLEEWLPFSRLAELLHTERSVKQIAQQAYELGKKGRGQDAKPTESGSPGRSRPTPTNGRGQSSDAVRAIKEGIVRGSGLPSLDEIFAK